jgi:hypothetical protein
MRYTFLKSLSIATAVAASVGLSQRAIASQVHHFRGQCEYQSSEVSYREDCDVTVKRENQIDSFWIKYLRADVMIPAEVAVGEVFAQVNGNNPATYNLSREDRTLKHAFRSNDGKIYVEVLEPLVEPPNNPSRPTGSRQARPGIVRGRRGAEVYVRKSAADNASIIGTLRSGTRVRAYQTRMDNQGRTWNYIQTDLLHGWILGKLRYLGEDPNTMCDPSKESC